MCVFTAWAAHVSVVNQSGNTAVTSSTKSIFRSRHREERDAGEKQSAENKSSGKWSKMNEVMWFPQKFWEEFPSCVCVCSLVALQAHSTESTPPPMRGLIKSHIQLQTLMKVVDEQDVYVVAARFLSPSSPTRLTLCRTSVCCIQKQSVGRVANGSHEQCSEQTLSIVLRFPEHEVMPQVFSPTTLASLVPPHLG